MKRKNRKYDPDSAAENELIRPAVANIDQALVILRWKSDPEPDTSGPFSCDDGTAERSDGNLFQ